MSTPGIPTTAFPVAVDAPLAQDANYRFTGVDRTYIDSQVRALMAYAFALKASILGFLNALDPAVIDGSSLAPTTLPTGASFSLDTAQDGVTVIGGTGATGATAACSCPLPGSGGAIPGSTGVTAPAKGTILVHVDVFARMPAGVSAGYWGWWLYRVSCDVETALTTVPSTLTPVLLDSDGSNSGAPPSGWSVAIALDHSAGASTAIVTTLTAIPGAVCRAIQTPSVLR